MRVPSRRRCRVRRLCLAGMLALSASGCAAARDAVVATRPAHGDAVARVSQALAARLDVMVAEAGAAPRP